MKYRAEVLFFVLSLIPAIAGSIAGIWLYGLQGIPGLIRWMPPYKRLFMLVVAAGFIPVTIFFVSRGAEISGHWTIASIMMFASGILSVIAIAVYGYGIWLYGFESRKIPASMPAIHRYDPVADKPLVRLAFSSDPHIGNPSSNAKATERILETVNTGGYDAFFILGDIAEMGFPGTDFETASLLFSKKLTQVPIVTLMGNHDALIGAEYRYRNTFNPDLYYRIDSRKVHIIGLNILWDGEGFEKTQRAWLENELASIPKRDTTIVITHAFIRASGYREPTSRQDWFDSEGLIRSLAPILENGGVDLVVSGHNHFMEYLEAPGGSPGIAYAIVGAMGGKSDPGRSHISEWSKWFCTGTQGFLDVDLYDGRMKLTFRDETGKPLHTITK